MKQSKWLSFTLLAVALVFLSACDRLPKEDVEDVERARESVASVAEFVTEKTAAYPKLLQANPWLEPYAEREKWESKFTEAKAEVDRVKKIFSEEIDPLLEANESKSVTKLRAQTRRVREALKEAKELARFPAVRAGALEETKASAKSVTEEARENYATFSPIASKLSQDIAAAKEQHANRAEDIDTRTAKVSRLVEETKQARQIVNAEYEKHSRDDGADYAALTDAAGVLANARRDISKIADATRKDLGELDKSWSRTLVDMKARFFVQVKQVSWDNSSDFNTNHEHTRPFVEVTEEIFEKVDDLARDGMLATASKGWGGMGFRAVAPADVLAALDLSKSNCTEGWRRGHDAAEYWVENTRVDYYHKYVEENGGETRETDWVKVGEETFDDHYNNLGMTIASKPYGMFADEAIKEAAPPGMAYVGDERYGQWKTDSSGNSFWEFYGKYMFISNLLGGGHPGYYTRSEWDTYRGYRRRSEPFYGGTRTNPRYGSASSTVGQSGRYARSSFVKSGGTKWARSDVRAAGARSRGGGPGGGGK